MPHAPNGSPHRRHGYIVAKDFLLFLPQEYQVQRLPRLGFGQQLAGFFKVCGANFIDAGQHISRFRA